MMSADGKSRKIWIEAPGAETGDLVTYAVDPRGVVASALLLYLVPVILLVVGALMGGAHGRGEGMAALGGGAGLVFSGLIIRVVTALSGKNSFFHPRLVSVDRKRALK